MSTEDQLRRALRSEAPPEGFAARVAARVGQQEARIPARSSYRWLAVAAGLIALVSACGYFYQAGRERGRAEAARHDLATALSITRTQINNVNQKINRRNGTL